MPASTALLRGAPLAGLLLVAGCRHEPDAETPPDTSTATDTEPSASLLPEGQRNLLLPFNLALDPIRRRAWVTSLVATTLAEVDLDAGELVAMWDPGGDAGRRPGVAVDGTGRVWLDGGPDLPVLDPASGTFTRIELDVARVDHIVGLDDGVIVVGATSERVPWAFRVSSAGEVLARRELEGAAIAIGPADDGARVAMLQYRTSTTQEVEVVDPETLEVQRACPSTTIGVTLVQASDGRFIVPGDTVIGMARCDGEEGVEREIGVENKSAYAIGDDILVVDRIGTDEAAGPNWGIARWFDLDLDSVRAPFATGKNSGHGAVDPVTGTLWLNSEGTTEIRGFDPGDGSLASRVRLGAHIETAVLDADEPGIVWATGRLSGTIARFDLNTHTVTTAGDMDRWPVSPVIHGDTFWCVDQLTQEILRYDRTSLAETARFDLGLPANELLTFDTLVRHPSRGTLFLADAQENVLIEIDPDDGAELGRWALAGDPVTDPDATGRLQALVVGDAVFTLRSLDGALTRVDPARSEATYAHALPSSLARELAYTTLPSRMWAPDDGSVLWLGGHAFDPVSLEEDPTRRLDASRVLAVAGDDVIAFRASDNAIVAFDPDGRETIAATLPDIELDDPSPVWDPAGRIVYLDNDTATVRVATLDGI